MFFVHHAEDPQTVPLDLLDEVSVKCQNLEGRKFLELADLIQICDIITMKIESLQVGEIKKLFVDCLEVVVGEIKPLQVLRTVHHILQGIWEGLQCADLIVI